MQMKTQMKNIRSGRQLLVFLCLAVALLVAVTPPVFGLLFLFLTPVWFFFAEVVSAPAPKADEICRVLPFPELLVFSPRPPPIQ
jgi:hypothetical protein